MARQSEGPWYRASKDGWYLTLNGKSVSLEVKGEKNRAEAIDAWHRLMASPKAREAPQKPAEPIQEAKVGASVKEVVDAFLIDAKTRVKANTYANYENLLTAFSEKHGKAKAEGFTIAQALAFVNRPKWSQAYRRTHLGAMKTAFKWAEEVGIIGKNPLKAMKRPSMPSRGSKAAVSAETHERLLEAATPQFRLLLTMLHETGARPSEVANLTAQDVDFASGVAIRLSPGVLVSSAPHPHDTVRAFAVFAIRCFARRTERKKTGAWAWGSRSEKWQTAHGE